MNDNIHKPKHYCFSKFEPKDVIREWGLNFNLGSAVKYIARAGRKDDIIQDLMKAREFLTFEIDALKAEMGKKTPPQDHVNCKCSSIPCIEDVLRMSSEDFTKAFLGNLYPTVLVGTEGDKWKVAGIDYVTRYNGDLIIGIRCERMKPPYTVVNIQLKGR